MHAAGVLSLLVFVVLPAFLSGKPIVPVPIVQPDESLATRPAVTKMTMEHSPQAELEPYRRLQVAHCPTSQSSDPSIIIDQIAIQT